MKKITNINKKESEFIKFIDKYFGAKYSVIFQIGKGLLNEKPTAIGMISSFMIFYIIYFVIRYSDYIWYIIITYIIAYSIKTTKRIAKKRNENKIKKTNNGKNNNIRRIKL